MSKAFPKNSTKKSMSVFPRFFLFYRVFGCFSAMGVQKHYKNTTKSSTKNPKTDFFSVLFSHVFGRFSMRGVQKHDLKNIKIINLALVPFRTLTHPPTTGVTVFFGSPLGSWLCQLPLPVALPVLA
jgi:hypothetical protein